jgi:hypothetical protein
MLPVGVDATAVRVSVLERVPVPGGDPETEPEVRPERLNGRTVLARDVGRPIGGAVIDDEDVSFG